MYCMYVCVPCVCVSVVWFFHLFEPFSNSVFLENVDTDFQANLGQIEEKPVPAAPVPSPVAPAPVPSRRNPPGGKSSLVLG